ncbi:MAG: AsmA family protein, partial [Gemmatimonadetes bacterium]|nr:AsmA family protein [Gemmatimonadota bacterium]
MSTPSPTTGRKFLRRAFFGILAGVLLYLGAAFALSRFLDPEALAEWLEPRMEQAFNRDVEIARAEVGILPFRVKLQEVTLADPTGLAPYLATVESIDLRVEFLPLLRREVRVHRLTIEAPRGDLHLGEGGSSNYGDFSAQPSVEPTQEGRRPFAMDLKGIRLVNGGIRFTKAGEEPVSVTVADLELSASARQDPEGQWLFVGSTEADLRVDRSEAESLLEETRLELAFEVGADRDFTRLEVSAADLRLGPLPLRVSGEVDRLKEPVRRVSLEIAAAETAFGELLTLLPDSVRARMPGDVEGVLVMALRAEGDAGPGQLPSLTGRIVLAEGRVTRAGATLADELTAELDILPDRTVRTQAQARVLDGPFSVNGTVSGADGMNLTLEATPDLAGLETLLELPEGVTAEGRLSTRVRIAGPMGDFRELRFRGNVEARGVRATHPGLGVPVQIGAGELQLDGVRVLLQDLPLLLGDDGLNVSGEVPDLFSFLDPEATPQFNGRVSGPRLDLAKLSTRPEPDSALTYGRVAFAKIGGRPVGGRTFQDAAREMGLIRPASLPLAGTVAVALDTVIDRKGRMEAVDARLDFGPAFVRVSQANFRRYGGEVSTAVNLGLSGEEAAPFSFRLQVRSLDAGRFLSQTTSLGRFARGTISIELDVIGTLDGLLLPDRPGLVGSGSFSLTGGGLATGPLTQGLADFLGLENLREPSIRDWGTSFVLEDGRVRLADATVQGAPGSPRVGGSVGLDGGLDLQSVFSLPSERLSAAALDRLGVAGEIAARVAQRPEVVQAVLRIGGSVFDPAIQADPRATAATLGAAVQEEVTREAQERIDAQRAEA